MRKIFCVMILLTMIFVGGCTKSEMSINSTDEQIKISATNANENSGTGYIKIPEGATLQVDAKISSGKLIVNIGNKDHEFDKAGQVFIDVPPGNYDLFLTAANGLTGEIILRALPKV
ncbi:MAG: hypothetical protein IJS69_06235 [Selenomonadaceae bacterium]|nr:hypothetical protein [Selenomonadaceae bacterium]